MSAKIQPIRGIVPIIVWSIILIILVWERHSVFGSLIKIGPSLPIVAFIGITGFAIFSAILIDRILMVLIPVFSPRYNLIQTPAKLRNHDKQPPSTP
jgi:hypothetical protein